MSKNVSVFAHIVFLYDNMKIEFSFFFHMAT